MHGTNSARIPSRVTQMTCTCLCNGTRVLASCVTSLWRPARNFSPPIIKNTLLLRRYFFFTCSFPDKYIKSKDLSQRPESLIRTKVLLPTRTAHGFLLSVCSVYWKMCPQSKSETFLGNAILPVDIGERCCGRFSFVCAGRPAQLHSDEAPTNTNWQVFISF